MKRSSLKNWLINICLVAVSVIVCLLAVEGLTRLLFKSGYTDGSASRRSNPPPYQHAAYYSKAFLAESAKPDGGLSNPKGTRILYPKDSKGVFYNVVNNLRYTTDQPVKYSHTIYIFGGSTVYNAEVPDKYTIASFLQRLYNASDPEIYRVVNCGVSSVNTMQQLEKLKSTKLLAGDKVVFYGGVNDGLLLQQEGLTDGSWVKMIKSMNTLILYRE